MNNRAQFPRRGEIWQFRQDDDLLLCLVMTNDMANQYCNRIVVSVLSEYQENVHPFEAKITCLGKPMKAMLQHLYTLPKQAAINKIDSIDLKEMAEVQKAIKIQLGIE